MTYEVNQVTKSVIVCNCCERATEVGNAGVASFFEKTRGWIRNGKKNFHVCPGCVKEFTDKGYEPSITPGKSVVTIDHTFIAKARCKDCGVMLGLYHTRGCRYFV